MLPVVVAYHAEILGCQVAAQSNMVNTFPSLKVQSRSCDGHARCNCRMKSRLNVFWYPAILLYPLIEITYQYESFMRCAVQHF